MTLRQEIAIRRATRLPGWRHRIAHAVAIGAGWLLFFWFWHLVAGQVTDSQQLQLLVIGVTVTVPVLTLFWVLHNLGIYHRRGARKEPPAVATEYRVDYNGRRVAADWPTLAHARVIEIGIAGEVKYYRGSGTVAPDIVVLDPHDDGIDTSLDIAAV